MKAKDSGLATGTKGSGRQDLENLSTELKEEDNLKAFKEELKKVFPGGRTRKEYSALAIDPARSKTVDSKGQKERSIILDLESQGKVDKVKRDPQGDKGADYIDTTNGQKWDIKSPVSRPKGHTSGRKGDFRLNKIMDKIKTEIGRGNKVILDTRRLYKEHRKQLKEEVKKQGLENFIIWYDKKGKKK